MSAKESRVRHGGTVRRTKPGQKTKKGNEKKATTAQFGEVGRGGIHDRGKSAPVLSAPRRECVFKGMNIRCVQSETRRCCCCRRREKKSSPSGRSCWEEPAAPTVPQRRRQAARSVHTRFLQRLSK